METKVKNEVAMDNYGQEPQFHFIDASVVDAEEDYNKDELEDPLKICLKKEIKNEDCKGETEIKTENISDLAEWDYDGVEEDPPYITCKEELKIEIEEQEENNDEDININQNQMIGMAIADQFIHLKSDSQNMVQKSGLKQSFDDFYENSTLNGDQNEADLCSTSGCVENEDERKSDIEEKTNKSVIENPILSNVNLQKHASESPFTCTYCQKSFNRLQNLEYHLRVHTGEKPYSCNLCDKTFTQSGSLTKHLRLHTGEKPYSCDECGKSFIESGSLKKHLRVHSGEKPYRCKLCDKSFSRLHGLKSHLQLHSEQKPYSCHFCNKSFSHSGSLKCHLRVHTGEKPYSCNHCDKSFTWLGSFKTHLRRHSVEKPVVIAENIDQSFAH